MKVKILKRVSDKIKSKTFYKEGDLVDLPNDRAISAINRGLAEAVEEKTKKESKDEK